MKKWKFPPISKMGKFLWLSHNHMSQDIAHHISDVGTGLIIAKHPKWGIMATMLSFSLSILNLSQKSEESIFENWEFNSNSFLQNLTGKLESSFTIKRTNSSPIEIIELSPETWVACSGHGTYWYPSLKKGLEIFWSKKSSYLKVVEVKSQNELSSYRFGGANDFELEEDPPIELISSSFSLKIRKKIKPFLEVSKSRVLLFSGPPGTGKSCLVNILARELVGGYIRVPSAAARTSEFWELTKYLPISSIIIDDIDHLETSSLLLEYIEQARKYCPLILLTSNSFSTIKGAVLRPGRIDQIFEVVAPDPILLKKLSKYIPEEYHEKLKDLYISYINEINERCEVLGTDQVEEWIEEMHKRVTLVGDGWNKE